ncbi:MAG TPA: TolC family protein [Oculatellaceae cyanobacterium]
MKSDSLKMIPLSCGQCCPGSRNDVHVNSHLIRKGVVLISLIIVAFVQVMNVPVRSASIDPVIMSQGQNNLSVTQSPIALSAVFDESLLNSPRVASIRAQLGIAKAARAQALVMPNPSFFVLEDSAQLAHQLGASVSIEPPWKLIFRLLAAKSQVKQADLEIAGSLWRFRGLVRRAYLDIVMANETMTMFGDLKRLAMDFKTVAQKRFAAGDVAALDARRAELAAMQAEADYRQSTTRSLQAKQKLMVIMGRGYNETIEVLRLPSLSLRGSTHELLPDFSQTLQTPSSLVGEALGKRLDIKIVEQKLVVNAENLRVAQANRYPNPVLNTGSSYSGNPPRPSVPTRGFYIAVSQELPILNRNQGEIARLKALNMQLLMELGSTRNEVTEQVLTAYQQLVAARDRIELFQTQILPVSAEVARMARRAYEFGQNDITSALMAQQENVQVSALYLEAVRSYQQSLTDLEQAVGRPL